MPCPARTGKPEKDEVADELDLMLATARDWLDAGHGVAIATVMQTWGSAPRRRGSHAIVRDDGLFEGSVSGGCVEGDVIVSAQRLLNDGGGFDRRDYGVQDDVAWRVGLACGGEIAVLIQTIDAGHFSRALLDMMVEARKRGETLTVTTDPESGRSAVVQHATDGLFSNVYAPPLRMMIVGAVHISQSLAPLAELVGYQVMIVDPRESFAAAERFADRRVDTRWSDEALSEWKPDRSTVIVTLTHDPKIDDPALEVALRSDAFYIAALGSRRTHAKRIDRLTAQGFPPEALARIDGPAGLAIGAVNPAEIALSIMAGATAALRLPRE